MNNKIAKIILPAVLSVGTLGAAALTATAGASTTTTVTHAKAAKGAVSLTGTVVKAQASKKVFWFKVGAKTYRASYSATTTFTKGTAASLVKGAAVTVTGSYVGKSSSVIVATSISA
jgi:hypothetical protein